MAQSSDSRNFFETDDQQSKRARRVAKSTNTHGSPIPLKSKLLNLIADPSSTSHIFLAESSGTVRHLDLTTSSTTALFRGPTAPVTCLALGGKDNRTLFAGSWDKSIWYWSLDDPKNAKGKCVGHSDFVKAVVCARLSDGKAVLVSGGADRKIIVWDLSEDVPKKLHTLKDAGSNDEMWRMWGSGGQMGGMLALQDLAVIDPPEGEDESALWIVSASSDPQIRTWKIWPDKWERVGTSEMDVTTAQKSGSTNTAVHKTTVYGLAVEPDSGDVWTASGDGTALRLAYSGGGFKVEEAHQHGGHVRTVAVAGPWIVTAGRDEDLKFWERASGELFATIAGHYNEVTGLLAHGGQLVSVSIDGTVRRWPLAKAELEALVEQQAKEANGANGSENGDAGDHGKDKTGTEESGMTADEEAELAALMDDD